MRETLRGEELWRLRAEQLQGALDSRIVIEQAKGVLAERYNLSVDDAFLLLRSSARSARTNIHGLAEQVVTSRETPSAVLRAIARDSRLRALAMRERSELTRERARKLQRQCVDHRDRLAERTLKQVARVHAGSRRDAVNLTSVLRGYRWYLIMPDEESWEVVVEFRGAPNDLAADLRTRIEEWLRASSIPAAHIRVGDVEVNLSCQTDPS